MAKQKVLVGMSGGVDSSVSAALLLEQGYEVIGGFIKNWSDSKDVWTGECAWRGERRDAMRVAAQLGIPLLTFDFEEQYREKVVSELFRGYAEGETPNPDVLCNEAIKFGLFLDEAKKIGADFVATGHYARLHRDASGVAHLLRGLDPEKDQSYFLYRVSPFALQHALFPIGELQKSEVRDRARTLNLAVAEKADSQGICFIGKLDMPSFLRKKIEQRPGEIVDEQGKVLGMHDGLESFTVGQRERILIAGGPWFVAEKNQQTNQLVVVNDADHPRLYATQIVLHDLHWTCEPPAVGTILQIQVRYRQEPVSTEVVSCTDETMTIRISEGIKAAAPGQSAVFYVGDECLGGGVIQSTVCGTVKI